MAEFVAELEKKGFAYRTEDGSYYFRIAKFPGYGKLSKKDFAGMEDGARVDVDEYEKDNARDFALWKGTQAGGGVLGESIGPGRPGWHIECSAMSMQELGETFDLHAGGEDLIFPASRKRNCAIRGADRENLSSTSGFMPAFCWWKARRCPKVPAISLHCAILRSRDTSRLRFVCCWRPYLTVISSTSPSTA